MTKRLTEEEKERNRKRRLVEAAAVDLDTLHLECRELGHLWKSVTMHSTKRPYFGWRRSVKCLRCNTLRHELINVQGRVGARRYEYPEGYQMAGLGIRGGIEKSIFRVELFDRIKDDIPSEEEDDGAA